MSAIIKNKVGKHIYLYESESYRDKEGKVRNKRRIVGKIDPLSGRHVYKPEYIEEKGLEPTKDGANDKRLYTVNDIKESVIKEFGVFYLLNEIALQIGLTDILGKVMPGMWKEILNLAFYIVASGEPAMYCEDWLYKSECYQSKELSSQRISELLATITYGERMSFFESWSEYRCEQEFIALDITSVSTYSELINDAQWGYNRDKEKLRQVNICMLLGEKSRLPILQVEYNGSARDVSTLKTTLQTASHLNLDNISLVMDKGFASVKNINAMLSKKSAIRFLIALPFTMSVVKELTNSERYDINRVENAIVVGNDVLRGVTRIHKWSEEHDVYAHVFLNTDTAVQAQNKVYGHVSKLINDVKRNPAKHLDKPDVCKYLNVSMSDNDYKITINNDAVSNELAHTGWLVLISNHVDNAAEAIQIYRDKDVVEKGFLRMKNCLDLARLRVHSDNAMQNRIFIGFIALIITAHIHKVMNDTRLYETWTMKKLIKTLERLKVQYIKNDRIFYPVSKDQKTIFKAFGLEFDL